MHEDILGFMNEIAHGIDSIESFRNKAKEQIDLLPKLNSKTQVFALGRTLNSQFMHHQNVLEKLHFLVESISQPKFKTPIVEKISELEQMLSDLKLQNKIVYNEALANIEKQETLKRKSLFKGSKKGLRNRSTRKSFVHNKEKKYLSSAVTETIELTESLRRVVRQMEDEVEHSRVINETFNTSTGMLSEALIQHEKLKGVIKTSRNYIIEHFKRDTKEKIILFLSFLIFMLTVSHIWWKRLRFIKVIIPSRKFFKMISPLELRKLFKYHSVKETKLIQEYINEDAPPIEKQLFETAD